MEEIYLVIKEGVFRHEIFGSFTDKEKARELAKGLADTDVDCYHSYDVLTVPLNGEFEREINDTTGHVAMESSPIYSFKKAI